MVKYLFDTLQTKGKLMCLSECAIIHCHLDLDCGFWYATMHHKAYTCIFRGCGGSTVLS